jgi:alpha-1,2-mannosyltransferase
MAGGRSPLQPLLTRSRVFVLCSIALAIEIGLFAFITAGTHGLIVPLQRPASTDFVSFYAAGSLADAGTPQLAYDQAAHYAAEQHAREPGIIYDYFYYPPTFLLLCGALARLPYLAAFVAFETITLLFYLFVVRRILAEHGWQVLVPILAFPPVLWTVGVGQNGFLTAGFFGAATLLVDRRPFASGLLFGALICKPHFALLVPLALIAGGHWRTLCGTVISAAGLCLLSLAIFGWQTWHDFLVAAAASRAVYVSGRIPFGGFVTPFGGARLLGATPGAAGFVQAVATLAAAGFVAVVWRRNSPLSIRAASLASATLVAVPLALFYDLVLGGIAAVWLLRRDVECRLPDWVKPAIAALYVFCLNPRGMAGASHLPIGSLIALGLMVLTGLLAFPRRAKGAARTPIPDRQVADPSRQSLIF